MRKKNHMISKDSVYRVLQRLQDYAMEKYRSAARYDLEVEKAGWSSYMSALTAAGIEIDKL